MKIQKTDGLYRKPALHGDTKVPLLFWAPLILILSAILIVVSLKTTVKQNEELPTFDVIRKHAYRVVAVGDIACSPSDINYNEGQGVGNACQQKDVGKAVENENADAVLLLGDIQYDTGEFTDFETSFVPYWRGVKAPIYSVAGNHDYGNGQRNPANIDGYKKAFDTFFPDATYSKEGKSYYDYGLGQWDIYALDSNCEYVGGCGVGSEQYDWLTSKVNASTAKCSIAMWHHPVYTSGIHKEAESVSRGSDFWKFLEPAGTDIVLNGHDHNYERLGRLSAIGEPSTDGMREFVSGTGGMNLRQTSAPFAPASEKIIDNSFGYLYLELYPGRYTWQFKDLSGEVLDRGADVCR